MIDVDFIHSLGIQTSLLNMIQVLDLLLTTSEAAKLLGKHEQVLRDWADKGVLMCSKSMGGTRYYSVKEVRMVAKKLNGKMKLKNVKALLAA